MLSVDRSFKEDIMRDDNPGDLSVRISFGLVIGGNASERGRVRPSIEIADGTSGKQLNIEITPEQLTEMLSGSAARVTADKVSGFQELSDWGKRHEHIQRRCNTRSGDYDTKDSRTLPHVAALIAEVEALGYQADRPSRNNSNQWVVIGRRYV